MSDQFSLENRASPAPSGAKGGIPVASSTTAVAWLPVGVDGAVVTADSSAANGVSYQFAGGSGTLRTLKETVFAGITPTSYTTGNTYTIDGSDYTCTIVGNGAIDMVASGLRIRKGTTGATENQMSIQAGNAGNFGTIIDEGRFRRRSWGMWVRIASYNYGTASSTVYGGFQITGIYPKWGVALRRLKGLNGAPNTPTGGIGFDFWWNGTDANPSSYPGVSTADVWMAYFRSPEIFDVYYGTYSGGWPLMENMTMMGSCNMQTTAFVSAAGSGPVITANASIQFQLGGVVASSGTYEIIYDRWRLTTWE